MTRPMTDERLQQKREIYEHFILEDRNAIDAEIWLCDEIPALFDEIKRLQATAPEAGRSTPPHIKDCDHYWDTDGRLWCYSEPSDTWTMRETPTSAALTSPTSARSYQRLEAEFGPLRPYADEENTNAE